MQNKIDIANNIRAERNRSKITIDKVVEELKVSKPTYIKYEKNPDGIKVGFLIKLAELFNCQVSDFFYQKH